MKLKTKLYLILLTYALFSCKQKNDLLDKLISGKVNEYKIPNKPSLRGVDVLDDRIVWVSGSKGSFARSIDAGLTWQSGKINGDTLLDFRDIQAFSAESAIVASVGSPSRFYKTFDGGASWKLEYENSDSSIFINSFDFYDSMNGFAWSDPINKRFFLIHTSNGGETWDTISIENLPNPLLHEAGFAASGTSIISSNFGVLMFVTGGDHARVIRSDDFGKNWQAVQTPIISGNGSTGIFSIGAIGNDTFIIAGGNYQKPDEAIDNIAISTDSGKSWSLTKTFPSGFRSSIKYLKHSKAIVTCGTNGVDISFNLGKTWTKTPLQGYNSIDISSNDEFIVFVGAQGKVAFASSKNLGYK